MTLAGTGDDERLRRQKSRSVAIAVALGLLVVLFYAATIIRLGPHALKREGRPGAPAATTPAATGTQPAPAADAACRKAGTC